MSMLFKRIKDWATSITSFRTGDVIPVDGPNGTAKMTKDSLLQETAQSTLAGNLAPAFDPTRTEDDKYLAGESIVQEGKLKKFILDHSGNWNASDVINRVICNDLDFCIAILMGKTPTVGAISTKDGYYLNSNGNEIALAPYSIADYDISLIDKVHVTARIGSSTYIWIYDSEGNALGSIQGNNGEGISFDRDVPLPSGAVLMRVPFSTSRGCRVTAVEVSQTLFAELQQADVNIKKAILDADGFIYKSTKDGYYLNSNGNEIALAEYSIADYDISLIDKVHVTARIGSSTYIWIYDSEGNALGSIQGNNSEGISFDRDVTLPSGAVLMRVPFSTSRGCRVTAVEVSQTLLAELQQAVAELQQADVNIKKAILDADGFIYKSTKDGYYLNSNGNEIALATLSIADYDVSLIDKVHVTARIGSSAYIWIYDSEGNALVSIQGNNSEGISFDRDVTLPSGAVLMRVPFSTSIGCRVTAVEEDNKVQKITKIGLIGDSIASGASSTSVSNRFINVCAAEFGAAVDNVAIGGDQLCNHENTGAFRQVASLASDDDLIVIFCGTNDFGHASTIGEVFTTAADGRRSPTTSDYNTTMCGGMNKLITSIYEKFGYIPIVICTPLQRKLKGRYSDGGSWSKNDVNKYLVDYVKAIRACAEFWGIPVFDAFSINMQPMVDDANSLYFNDGLHPNNRGHKLLGKNLAKFIQSQWIDLD